MRKYLVIALSALILFASSCAQTQLVSGIAGADIYVNGVFKGKGSVEVKRAGVPKKIEVSARYQGRELGKIIVKRKFDIVTLIAGLYTYGVGIVFTFRYPAMVYIPGTGVNEIKGVYDYNGKDWGNGKSKWD